MEKINWTDDMMKHSDEELIDFLYDRALQLRRCYTDAIKNDTPDILFASFGGVNDMYDILKAMDDRNKEKAV